MANVMVIIKEVLMMSLVMDITRNWSSQPAFESVFFYLIKNICEGEAVRCPPQTAELETSTGCTGDATFNLRACGMPQATRSLCSIWFCPNHLSKYLSHGATPLMPTSAFWPLFCQDFDVAPSIPLCHTELTWCTLIYLWHLTFVYPAQVLVNGLLNLPNSVSALLHSTFPEWQIEYFILEHHKRLPQQLADLTVILHFKELHRVVNSSRGFHEVVFLAQSLEEWVDILYSDDNLSLSLIGCLIYDFFWQEKISIEYLGTPKFL